MPETTTTDLTVSKTILEQLGGHRFRVMTGSTNFTGDVHSLSFKLTANKSGGTHMRITLTPADTYLVEVLKCSTRRPAGITLISRHEDVYAENLQDLFTDITGLDTRIGKVTFAGGAR